MSYTTVFRKNLLPEAGVCELCCWQSPSAFQVALYRLANGCSLTTNRILLKCCYLAAKLSIPAELLGGRQLIPRE